MNTERGETIPKTSYSLLYINMACNTPMHKTLLDAVFRLPRTLLKTLGSDTKFVMPQIWSKSQDLFNVMGSMYAIVIFFGVQNTSSVQPVVDVELTVFYRERAARMYSVIPYAFGQLIHLDRFQEEVIKLLLAGIEAILSSDDLQVASEDAVYDFFLKWTRAHYPLIDEC
ncbi:hypothetical protein T459_30346 [Capsicum annuum]|uniref:Uncharacterized protein n=1 Tax=Capsicum annuum TaxID=4072 RepID=A0A2G2Y8P2_CAPAN|nr:hypothetical protein T459_30346 [Capsicum annuum]